MEIIDQTYIEPLEPLNEAKYIIASTVSFGPTTAIENEVYVYDKNKKEIIKINDQKEN